jgi:crotonobetainyl-CoA:carnitine CoA-transferase CaiB-like acyl-CoA transferase
MSSDNPLRPAESLLVVDLGVGMAAALTVKMLADAGATVVRVPPPGGDPFYKVYPGYRIWKQGGRIAAQSELPDLLPTADLCIIGGEDHPDLSWNHDAERLCAAQSRLIVVHIGSLEDKPRVDLLVQARLGLVNEQYSNRPVYIAARTPTYGAALTAVLGAWAALIERESSGRGQVVRATLEQGAALFWSQIWMSASRPSASFERLPPRDVQHLIFQCADGGWIQFVLGIAGALAKTYAVLGISRQVDVAERGMPDAARGPTDFFAERAPLAAAIRTWQRDELVSALRAAGIAVEPVLLPGEAWSDPQVIHAGLIAVNSDQQRFCAPPWNLHAAPRMSGTSARTAAANGGPLAGLRVVDFGNFIAGPFASKLLADLGADVIKVEPPTGLANLTGLRNAWSCNRGKRSIVVDMKSAEGRTVIEALCRSADVTHHNFRVGVAERLGIDPPSLRRLQPQMVTLQTSGYGASGPKAHEPAWDMIMQALCGLEARAGGQGNPPVWYRSALVDYATGAVGAIATLMGVFHQRRHCVAVEVEVSLLSTALFLLSELIQDADGTFTGAPLLNREQTGFHPAEALYRVSDGWIAVAARTDQAAAAFASALAIGAVPDRSQWGDPEARKISAKLRCLSIEDALTRLTAKGVWAEKCHEGAWDRLRTSTAARARGLVIEVDDPLFGRIEGSFGLPVHFSRSAMPLDTLRSAPAPNADARQILTEIGMSESKERNL